MSEAEALIERHHLATKGSVLEEAWLLATCTSPEANRSTLATDMPAAVVDRVRASIIPPQAAMKYQVPLARPTSANAGRFVEALGSERPRCAPPRRCMWAGGNLT